MLKVGSPQPPMDMMPPMGNEMPPMDNQGMMGGDPNAMGGEIPPMDGQGDMSGGSEFDTNFDPGVDANEDDDPKKYIQQLTGKLSQSLRKYNNELPKPDDELCKYVAGMILKQTTEGLTDSDKKDIIDKVNGNEEQGDEEHSNGEQEMQQMDDQAMMGGYPNANQQPMMEDFNHRKLVNEIFQELTQKSNDDRNNIQQRPIKDIGFRKKPFTAPNMY